MRKITLVESVLILLALLPAAGRAVDLVHKAAAALGVLALLALGVAAGELVDVVHDAVKHNA